MTKEQIIEKWENDLNMWKRVCNDPLMYTRDDRLKASAYVLSITTMLSNLKELIKELIHEEAKIEEWKAFHKRNITELKKENQELKDKINDLLPSECICGYEDNELESCEFRKHGDIECKKCIV